MLDGLKHLRVNAQCIWPGAVSATNSIVLTEIVKLLPENGPGHQQVMTHVNGCVIDRIFVLDVERNVDWRNKAAVMEIRQHVHIGWEADYKQRGRRRVSIAVGPI